jgi:hypothetical protein
VQKQTPRTLSWTQVLTALKTCAGQSVLIRDGKHTAPAASIALRPSAKGAEYCLFSGPDCATRLDLVARLEKLSASSGRRFMTSARAQIDAANLLIERVGDDVVDGVAYAVIETRRPALGFNPSRQTGDSTHLRSKRIKRG